MKQTEQPLRAIVDFAETAILLADLVQEEVRAGLDVPDKVILALSSFRAQEKKLENVLDLVLANTVTLN